MLGTPPDTYTSALMDTNTLQSGGILSNTVYRGLIWSTSNFLFLRNVDQSLIVLFFEMLFIKELNPQLNTQKDSIRAKLFT